MVISAKHYWLGGLGLFSLWVVFSLVGAWNTANAYETQIPAEHTNLSNILGQYSLTITEMAQVPDAAKADFVELVEAQMSGRYGEDGSQATFQWLQEQNISLDGAMYTRIQDAMREGRTRFERAQEQFIDTKRSYERVLGNMPGVMFYAVLGLPNINLDDYNTVTSQYANDAFTTGIEKGLTL